MKFEKPYIEISMFNENDIVTTSGTVQDTDMQTAIDKANTLAGQNENAAVFKITF